MRCRGGLGNDPTARILKLLRRTQLLFVLSRSRQRSNSEDTETFGEHTVVSASGGSRQRSNSEDTETNELREFYGGVVGSRQRSNSEDTETGGRRIYRKDDKMV